MGTRAPRFNAPPGASANECSSAPVALAFRAEAQMLREVREHLLLDAIRDVIHVVAFIGLVGVRHAPSLREQQRRVPDSIAQQGVLQADLKCNGAISA